MPKGKCQCKNDQAKIRSLTSLPGDLCHIQVNCLECGAGWVEDSDQPPSLKAVPDIKGEAPDKTPTTDKE